MGKSGSFRSSIYSSISWRIVLDVFSRGSFIIMTFFVARILGVGEFGKFAYALSIAQVFYVFTDLGTHLQLMKEMGEQRSKNQFIWLDYLRLKLCMKVVCLLVFLFIFSFLWKWEKPWVLLMALIWMFGNSLLDFNQIICNGLKRMDVAKNQMVIQRSITVAGGILALFFFPSLEGILTALAVGGTLGALISTYYFFGTLQVSLSWRFQWKKWGRILKTSYPNAIGQAFGHWYLRMGIIVVAWYWTTQAVGEYSAAFRVYEACYILPASIMGICVPHLSEARQLGRVAYGRELGRVWMMIIPLALVTAGGLVIFSPTVIGLLFGEAYGGSVGTLRIFGLASGVLIINQVTNHLMIIHDRQKRHALHSSLMFLVSLTLYLVFVQRWGGAGAAMSLLLTETLLFITTSLYIILKIRPLSRP